MPLIARVMDLGRDRIRRSRPHRRDHRPRQLHRPAGRHLGRARHRACGRQAGDRPLHACRLRGARISPRTTRTHVVAAIDARHDHVYLQVFGIGGRTLVAPRIAPLREAVRAAMTGPARIVGSAANLLAAAWPRAANRAVAGRAAQRARHRLGRAARRRRGRRLTDRPSRSICARPTRSRRTPPGCRADDRIRHPSVRAQRARAVGSRRRATPRAIARCTRASFHRGWSDGEFERLLLDRTSSRIAPWRDAVSSGFILSRLVADEAEILSVAVAGVAARQGTGAATARSASAPARRPRRAHGVPRSRRGQRSRRAGSIGAPDSARSAAARAIIRHGQGAAALVLRRDLA